MLPLVLILQLAACLDAVSTIVDDGVESPPATAFSGFRFVVEPADVVVTIGRAVTLDCSTVFRPSGELGSSSSAGIDIKWMKDGAQIASFDSRRTILSNGSLHFSSTEHSSSHRPDGGLYQCYATLRSVGTIVSRKARLQLAYLEAVGADAGATSQPIRQELHLQPGDRVLLACSVHGVPRPKTRWYRNDVELSVEPALAVSTSGSGGASRRTVIHDDGVLEMSDVQPSDSGRYRCRADLGSESKYGANITHLVVDSSGKSAAFRVPPQFVMKPRDIVAQEGATVLLHCGANGRDRHLAPPRIVWLRDGSTIEVSEWERTSIVGFGSLRISAVEEHDTGLYTCRATNMEDSIDSDATLTVNVPPRIQLAPKDTIATIGRDVQLTCATSGVPIPTVTWLKNGDAVIPSDYFQLVDAGGSLRILGALETDSGMYQCVAANEVGNVLATAQLIITSNDGAMQTNEEQPAGTSSAPLDLSAAHISVRFITLSWQPPEDSGASEILGYTVFWKESSSDRERVMNSTALEANIQQLKPATSYEFRVIAWNAFGSSSSATVVVETLSEALVPNAPANVSVTAASTTAIEVHWDSPANSNGPIVTYKVYYYSPDDDEGEQDITVEDTSCVLTDLKKFRQYWIRVVAFNANGPGVETEEYVCRTLSDVPAMPPQNVTAEALSSTSIVIRWEPPQPDAQNGIITGYKIRYRQRGDKIGDSITTDGNQRMYTLTNLNRNTEYYIRAQAMTVNGSGPATPWINVETFSNDLDESMVPGQPASLLVRPGSNTIQVSWTAPVEQNILVRGYVLGYGIGIPDVFRQVLDAQQRTHTIKSLKPSSEYVISLKAFNNVGEGPPIYENMFTTEETTPEPLTPMMPPIGVKATVLSATSVLLTWTDTSLGRNQVNSDNNRFYIVRYNPKMARKPRLVNTTQLNVHLDDLRPDTEYEFSIKVIKGQRQSTWSLSVFNQTGQAAPTTSPRNLDVSPVENRPTSVSLTWLPPRQTNGPITGYLVFYTTDPTLPDRDWAVEGVLGDRSSTILRDLSPSSTYYFKIQARNSKGYGPPSPNAIYRTATSDGYSANILYDEEEALKYATGKVNQGGFPSIAQWIITGTVGGIAVVAIVVVAVIFCRRQATSKRQTDAAATAEVDPEDPKTGTSVLKPPDLWIHDQVEQRRTSSAHSGTEAAPSVAGSQGFNDDSLSIDTVQEDERYRRMAIRPPLMIPVDHPPPPRDPLALIKPNGHLTSPDGSTFGGLGAVRTGLYTRPTALQYTAHNTPRVNAGDLCQPSLQADHALSTLDRHRKLRDTSGKVGSNPRLAVQPQPQTRQQGQLPSSGSTTSSSSSGSSRTTTIPPPPQPASTSLLIPGGSSMTKSPMPMLLASRSPDVTLRSEKVQKDPELRMSMSTEELSAEMANLEGLMKDLNAITQHEFQC